MRSAITLLVLLLATTVAPAAENGVTPELIAFRLKDQNDALHTAARYRNAPLLVCWGDRRGSEHLDDWSPVLRDSLARELRGYRVRAVDVAHTKGAPFFVKGKIKERFRERDRGPVLLDWEGVFASAYACREDHLNVLLFDREGRVRATWSITTADPDLLADVLAAARAAIAQRDASGR